MFYKKSHDLSYPYPSKKSSSLLIESKGPVALHHLIVFLLCIFPTAVLYAADHTHWLKRPERTLWKGKTIVNDQTHYCVLTDDDRLYLFSDEQDLVSPTKTIDLALYACLTPIEKDTFLLAPKRQAIRPFSHAKTFTFHQPEASAGLLHLFRYATHQYYYYDPGSKQLQRLQKEINTSDHHLIQLICRIEGQQRQKSMYCLFPNSLKITYEQLATLLSGYLNTSIKRLALYDQEADFKDNQIRMSWPPPTRSLTFCITFNTYVNYIPFPTHKIAKVNTCPHFGQSLPCRHNELETGVSCLQCPIYQQMVAQDPFVDHPVKEGSSKTELSIEEQQEHLDTFVHGEKPTCPDKDQCKAFLEIENSRINSYDPASRLHTLIFFHPRKKKITFNVGNSPFSYQEDFATMHPLDIRKESPLNPLTDPRVQLKALILEMFANDMHNSLIEKDEEGKDEDFEKKKKEIVSNVLAVKYLTSHELPWLKKVEEKMQCKTHRALGYPLNIAEMCAIYLYSLGKPCTALGKAQRKGDFDKFPTWDRLLMHAILKLHRVEQKRGEDLYSGVRDVHLSKNQQQGFFKTYVSTTPYKKTAIRFLKDSKERKNGMMMYFTKEMQIQFPNCDISWISKFEDEKKVLFARSADFGVSCTTPDLIKSSSLFGDFRGF